MHLTRQNSLDLLKEESRHVAFISHNFSQVLRLSDAVWVMRAGRCVAGRRTKETDGDEIVALITGARPGDRPEAARSTT
jgi:ribose transport system ATP-binding protein